MVVGAGGALVQTLRKEPSALQRAFEEAGVRSVPLAEDGVWTYAYVATDSIGQPAVAASGQLRQNGGCTNTGRVAVGEVLVNPGSNREDIEKYIDLAERNVGVGRLDESPGIHQVQLPNGSTAEAMPLVWFQPEGGSFCQGLRSVFANIEDLERLVGGGEVDAELVREDAREGLVRYVGKWTVVDEAAKIPSRPEILFDDGSVSLLVRMLPEDGPSIIMARIDFSTAVLGGTSGGKVEE